MIVGILPWLGLFFQSLWSAARPAGPQFSPEKVFKPRLLLLIWSVFIFFFFSYSSSKLPSYILPIFPALALLLARQIEAARRKQLMFAAGLIALFALAALPFIHTVGGMAKFPEEAAGYAYFVPWIYAASISALIGAGLALWYARRDMQGHFVLSLAISGFIFGQLLMLGSDQIGRDRSGIALIPKMQAHLQPEMTLYALAMYEQCIPFYLQRTMVLVEHTDELAFGLQHQPELWIPKRADFIAKWTNGPAAMVITRLHVMEELKQAGVPFYVLNQDARRVVLLNRPPESLTAPQSHSSETPATKP